MSSKAYDIYNRFALHVLNKMSDIEEILAVERVDRVDNLHEVLTRLRDKLNVRHTHAEWWRS
jgi:hypothetical protein